VLKKSLILAIGLSLTFTLSTLAYYYYNKPDVVMINKSMDIDYGNIDNLTKESVLVVKGKIIDESNVRLHTTKQDENEENYKYYYTDKVFKVNKVYKSDGSIKSGNEIKVRTADAKTNDVLVVTDSTVEKNKSYVLFLKPSVYPQEDGAYTFLNPDQSIFELDGKGGIKNKVFKNISKFDKLEEIVEKIN
jgi:hypothetical protein